MRCPWGEKAFSNYLGPDRDAWRAYDATELVRAGARAPEILIDQGEADQFLETQLHPIFWSRPAARPGSRSNCVGTRVMTTHTTSSRPSSPTMSGITAAPFRTVNAPC
jgi:hypothetical protein